MRTIIAGSRTATDYSLVKFTIRNSQFDITEVVCGGAKGIDSLGQKWAIDNKVPLRYFYPDWDKYKKFAGPERNKRMAEYADALILIWDGKSKGSASMLQQWQNIYGLKNVYQFVGTLQ
jgi:hypothetical protein